MLTASKPLADRYWLVGLRFGAHVAFYPLCYQYNDARRPEYVFKELTGAPVFIHAAELDTFDAPDSCQTLVDSLPAASRSLVRLKMYPGATHAFDRTEPESVIDSPAASLGKGGKVRLAPDPSAGATAREATAKFFSEVFGLGK